MSIVVFDHNEDGFKRWMDEHPDGYVLNCYRMGKVHSVRCKSYKSAGPLMTHTRAKACSASQRQLCEYAEQHRIDAIRCARC